MMFLASGFSWTAVHAFIAAAGLLGTLISWFFKRIYDSWYKNHEKRLRNLEDGDEERDDILYGDDENPLQVGLTREVAEVKQEIEEIQQEIDESGVEREELSGRLTELEARMENLLSRLDQLEEDE